MEMLGKFGEATCAFYLQEVPIKKEEEIPHSFFANMPISRGNHNWASQYWQGNLIESTCNWISSHTWTYKLMGC